MGFWGFIIPIIVQLIVAFITELLKDLNPLPGRFMLRAPNVPDLDAAKPAFMAKLKWRFWLGPKRYQYASALYDKMHRRFSVTLSSGGVFDVRATVANCTDGLNKLTPADLGDGGGFSDALNYEVRPNGLVQGGVVSYVLDASKGLITYRASIKIGKWFLSKTYQSNGQYQVDPTLLNPTNLVVGKVVKIGALQMKVTSLALGSALVSLSVDGQKATGTAVLDTGLSVTSLRSLDATVFAYGMELVVSVRRVTNFY